MTLYTVPTSFDVDIDTDELHELCMQADDIGVEVREELNAFMEYKRQAYLRVTIHLDGGDVMVGYTSLAHVHQRMIRKALEMGWTTDLTEGIYKVDLGQFDPWDVSGCVQVAAFGEIIVG